MIRKNISLHEEDLKKIESIIEKHEGNLSATVREIIGFVDFMSKKFGSLEEANKIGMRIKGICIPETMLNWFLTHTDKCLPDEATAGCIEEMHATESVYDLAKIADMGFAVDVKVHADDDQEPTEVTIHVFGEIRQREFVTKILACFLAENKGLTVEDVSRRAPSTTVKLKRSGERGSEGNYKMVRESLIKHFT